MSSTYRKSFRLLQYPLLLMVYALFFVVQLFFNIDIPKYPFAAQSKHKHGFVAMHSVKVKRSAGYPQQAKKVRLNKRFHPSEAPTVSAVVVEASYTYVEKPTGHYRSPYFPLHVFSVSTLRGPPAVA